MSKHTQWLTMATEAMARTAQKDNEYWRATYTEQDKQGVAQLSEYMREAGMEVYFDAVGNLFGRIDVGADKTIVAGSHRDTVRQGGKYDGILGVLTAIHAVDELTKELGKPKYNVEVVAICEEESSRFPTSYLGSRHICGLFKEDELKDLDDDGVSLGDAMKEAGYLKEPLNKEPKKFDHFVELHIEQGAVLEHEKKQIGIVSAIVGLLSGEVTFKGHQNHAGTTPMSLRKDPVPTLAEYISRLHKWAEKYGDDIVCTVGKITTQPGNANVIADQVTMTFDIRSANKAYFDEAKEVVYQFKDQLQGDIDIKVSLPCDEPPVALDEEGIRTLEKLAEENGFSYKTMVSGAGHDSQVLAPHYKTNMIFVPSVGGISHSTLEYTRPEDMETGCELLKQYLRKLAW